MLENAKAKTFLSRMGDRAERERSDQRPGGEQDARVAFQEPPPVNDNSRGYVLGGIEYIPLGVVDTDFSQANSEQQIDFMRISGDIEDMAYLSSGSVTNGSAASITIVLLSQYATFGSPRVTLAAGQVFSWTDQPITGIRSSVAASTITMTAVKYAARDAIPVFSYGSRSQSVSKS